MKFQIIRTSAVVAMMLALPSLCGAQVTGSGTTRYIPKWSSSSAINNSIIYQYDNGSSETIGIGTTTPRGKLGFLTDTGCEICAADSSQTFNIAAESNIVLQAGNATASYGVDMNSYVALGAGGSGFLVNLYRKKLTTAAAVGVGLGADADTEFTNGFRLKVCGNVKAKGYTTDNSGWCDYVFKPDYALMPLNTLEHYVTTNNHLPGVPTAAEVAEKGVELGAMTSTLMLKVEELTLYVIALQKQNDALRSQVAQISSAR